MHKRMKQSDFVLRHLTENTVSVGDGLQESLLLLLSTTSIQPQAHMKMCELLLLLHSGNNAKPSESSGISEM